MKKRIKAVLTAATILTAALMLCSCKELDKLKWDHAVYTDSTINTIEFRGQIYELVERGPNFGDQKEPYDMIYNNAQDAIVTEPDVPVLLAAPYGEQIHYNGDPSEAPAYIVIEDYIPDSGLLSRFYCERSRRKDFEQLWDQAEMDHFYLEESDWDTFSDDPYTEIVPLGEETAAVIMKTIGRPFDEARDHSVPDQIENLSEDFLQPFFCDQSMTFTNNQIIQIARTEGSDVQYYIVSRPYSRNLFDDNGILMNADWKLVAEEDAAVIAQLFDDYRKDIVTHPLR